MHWERRAQLSSWTPAPVELDIICLSMLYLTWLWEMPRLYFVFVCRCFCRHPGLGKTQTGTVIRAAWKLHHSSMLTAENADSFSHKDGLCVVWTYDCNPRGCYAPAALQAP